MKQNSVITISKYQIAHLHLQVKPVETKPGYRMEPSDRTIQQIECICLAEIYLGLDKSGLTVSV